MFCHECGTELEENSHFCHECGTKTEIDNFNDSKVVKTKSDVAGDRLGSRLNQIQNKLLSNAKEREDDIQLLNDFVGDIGSIVGKYESNQVKSEKELEEQIRKIDFNINLRKRELDKKLKVLNSDIIQIKKIRDENNPLGVRYSLSIKQKKRDFKTVHFTDSNNKRANLKVYLSKESIHGTYSINIPDLDFRVHFYVNRSKDGNFILATKDQYYILEGGIRKIVKGRAVFINQAELFLIDDLERPNDGKLAENGNFIINDWMASSELCGTFYAFNSKCEVIIKTKFNSNLYNNAISEDGRYAVLETVKSKSDDQDKIFFFDLKNRNLLWERKREAGNIKGFKFDLDQEILIVSYANGRTYRHGFNGDFLDQDKLEKERIKYANGYELFKIAEEKMKLLASKETSLSDYEEVLSLLKKASRKNVRDHTKARIHRIMGEIYYNHNNTDGAIQNFEKALLYDPKIGVRRLYDKIKVNSDV